MFLRKFQQKRVNLCCSCVNSILIHFYHTILLDEKQYIIFANNPLTFAKECIKIIQKANYKLGITAGDSSTMIDYVEAGARIRARRKELGLTQEVVSEKIDVTPSFYSQIESGARKAGINTFVNISQELSLSLDYILCNDVLTPLPENFDEVEKMIFYRIKNFTVSEKKCVLEVVAALGKIF